MSGSYQGTIERDNGLGLLGMTMVVDFTYDDIAIEGYEAWPAIKADVAV